MNTIINEILTYLFNGYIANGGTSIFSINEIAQKHGQDSNKIGKYLVDEGLVKHQRFGHDGFSAAISTTGILQIRPDFFNDYTSKIVSILGINGNGWVSLMETLDFEPKDFQIAFDIAKLLQSIDILETQFHHDDIIVTLTFRGQQLFEQHKASFI